MPQQWPPDLSGPSPIDLAALLQAHAAGGAASALPPKGIEMGPAQVIPAPEQWPPKIELGEAKVTPYTQPTLGPQQLPGAKSAGDRYNDVVKSDQESDIKDLLMIKYNFNEQEAQAAVDKIGFKPVDMEPMGPKPAPTNVSPPVGPPRPGASHDHPLANLAQLFANR